MQDLYQINNEFTDEERLIQETVRRFADDEAIPLMMDAYERAEFPSVLIKRSAELGLLGLTLPVDYSGSGASSVSYGLVCQELERADSGLRSFVSVQSSLCMYPIYAYGSEAQKKHWLPLLASAEKIACFGLTEPDSGSDPASMTTFAEKVDGGWHLNGSKMWITNAPIADVAIVWANSADGIRGFLVEKECKGFTRNKITHKGSLRASITGELVFEDVFIPDENILPGSTKGIVAPLSCLSQARFGIAWGAIGAAMSCFDIALDYVKERKQFNKPLASFQLVQKDLADMYSEIVKAQCLNLQLARLKDKGEANHVMISLAKRNSCQQALSIARKARNLLGANGISLEYHVIRHMNNLESVFTYEGTDNIHTLVVGRYLTDINAFS